MDGNDSDFVDEQNESLDGSLDQSSSDFILDESLRSNVSASTSSLRPSRRRVQKHSAVVLNSARMKKLNKVKGDGNDLNQISEETEESANEFENSYDEQLEGSYEESVEPEKYSSNHHDKEKESGIAIRHPSGDASEHQSESSLSHHHHPKMAASLLNKISPTAIKRSSPTSPKRKPSKSMITETQAAFLILEWWNKMKKTRLQKFTIQGKWSFSRSSKVLSLILGYRARKLFRTHDVTKLIMSQKDLKGVLKELLEQHVKEPKRISSPKSKYSLPLQTVNQTIDYWLLFLNKLQSSNESILTDSADQTFAKSVIKQIFAERVKLLSYLWSNDKDKTRWMTFPKPGYWLFPSSKVIKKVTVNPHAGRKSIASKASSASSSPFSSPSRPLKPSSKGVQETPPHVKAAINAQAVKEKALKKSLQVNVFNSNLHNTTLLESTTDDGESLESEGMGTRGRLQKGGGNKPKPLKDLLGNGSDDRPAFIKKGGGSRAFPVTNKSNDSKSAKSSNDSLRPSTAAPSNITRKRAMDGGHIQLEVISGERLIPAKKVHPFFVCFSFFFSVFLGINRKRY
jgi:hypothetical protein